MRAAFLEADVTAGLSAIALADLVAEADLQTRVDRKYLLPSRDLPRLMGAMPGGTRVLQIDGRRTFGYA